MPTSATIPAGTSAAMQALMAHSVAAQVKTSTALQAVQASHAAFLRGVDIYRNEMTKFKAAQLRVEQAKQDMDRLAAQEKSAKTDFAAASADAAKATQDIAAQASAEASGASGTGGTSSDAGVMTATMQAQANYQSRLQAEGQAATSYKRAKALTDAAAAAVPKAPSAVPALLSARLPKVQRAPVPIAAFLRPTEQSTGSDAGMWYET